MTRENKNTLLEARLHERIRDLMKNKSGFKEILRRMNEKHKSALQDLFLDLVPEDKDCYVVVNLSINPKTGMHLSYNPNNVFDDVEDAKHRSDELFDEYGGTYIVYTSAGQKVYTPELDRGKMPN